MIFGGSMFFGAREKVVEVLSGATTWTAPEGVTQIDLRIRGGNATTRTWLNPGSGLRNLFYLSSVLEPVESAPDTVDLNAELSIVQAMFDALPTGNDEPKLINVEYRRYGAFGDTNPPPERWPEINPEEYWWRVTSGTNGARKATGWSSSLRNLWEPDSWPGSIWSVGDPAIDAQIRDVQYLAGTYADGLTTTAFGQSAAGGIPTNPPFYDFATMPAILSLNGVPVQPGDNYPISALGISAWVEITYFA